MAVIELWKSRDKKELDPALFSQTAEKLAKDIDADGSKKSNKSTQLRRFFDELVRLNTQAQASESEWNIILSRVHMIVAKAAYAKGRDLVTDSFVALIRDGINQVETREDLQIFTSFFESFVGFYKVYRKD